MDLENKTQPMHFFFNFELEFSHMQKLNVYVLHLFLTVSYQPKDSASNKLALTEVERTQNIQTLLRFRWLCL